MADTKLTGKTVLMVIPHTQFRDEEFFEPQKLLVEAGAKVVVASTTVRTCYGMAGGSIASEITIADAKADDYQALVICGGSSVPDFFWNDKKLQELTVSMANTGKIVAAICLSTVVLAKAKLLADREATVYFLPQAIQELKTAGAKYVQQPIVVHKNIILAEGPPESSQFGQAICSALAASV
jgi:protease I